jgi:hypothetical protein
MKYIKKSGYLQIMEIRHGLWALLVLAVGMVTIVLTLPGPTASDDAQLTWLVSVSALVVAGFFILRKLVIRSDKFSAGIKAEQKVKKELGKLNDDFTVFHNYPLPRRGDIDFVVVGPTGVFGLEVKRRKMPTAQELDKFTYQAKRQAEDLSKLISEMGRENIKAVPVVIMVDLRTVDITAERNGVQILTSSTLISYISSRAQFYKDYGQLADMLKNG